MASHIPEVPTLPYSREKSVKLVSAHDISEGVGEIAGSDDAPRATAPLYKKHKKHPHAYLSEIISERFLQDYPVAAKLREFF